MTSQVQSNMDFSSNDIMIIQPDPFKHLNGFGVNENENNIVSEQDLHSNTNRRISSEDSALDSVILLDVDKLSLEDETNWLYKSNNDLFGKDAKEWMNEAFRDERSKNNSQDLSRKLDEISRGSQGKLDEIGKPLSMALFPGIDSVDDSVINSKDKGHITQVIGVVPTLARKDSLDASKWKEMNGAVEMDINNTTPVEIQKPRNATNKEDMTGSGYMLADYTDVQVLARLQEQSLRMSFNSPLNNALSKSLNRSSGALIECVYDEAKENKAALNKSLHKSTGALLDKGSVSARKKTDATLSSSKIVKKSGIQQPSSVCNSMPNSPYNSHRELSQRPISTSNYDPYQKSMPNLTKQRTMSAAMQSHPSDPRLNSNRKPLSLPRQTVPTRTASQPIVTATSRSAVKPVPSRTTSTQIVSRGLSTATPRGQSAQPFNPRLSTTRQSPSPSKPARLALSVAPTRVVVRTEVPKGRTTANSSNTAVKGKPMTPTTTSANKPVARLASATKPNSANLPSRSITQTNTGRMAQNNTARMAPTTNTPKKLPTQPTTLANTSRTAVKAAPINSRVPVSADPRIIRTPRSNTPLAPSIQGKQPGMRAPIKASHTPTTVTNKSPTGSRSAIMFVQNHEEEEGEDWKDGCY